MLEEGEDSEDVNVETVVSSEDSKLSCGQQMAGSDLIAIVLKRLLIGQPRLWMLPSLKTLQHPSLGSRRMWRCPPHTSAALA